MKYTVDRIEENLVVCEDENENIVNLELSLMPDGIKEGDILIESDSGFEICKNETEERRKRIAKLQKSIFTKKKIFYALIFQGIFY